MKSIFLTYNQGSQIGKNTALRMQTISNLYGLSVFLPARSSARNSPISQETARRIEASTFVVSFALEELTYEMQNELNYAIQLEKPIVVLFDAGIGQTIEFGDYENYTSVWIDYENTDETLHKVANFLDRLEDSPSEGVSNHQGKKKKNSSVGTAIIGIGLGLLALWALGNSD